MLKTFLQILSENDMLGLIKHVGLGFYKTYVIFRLGHLCLTPIWRNWYILIKLMLDVYDLWLHILEMVT
jgi:hypothetical protein